MSTHVLAEARVEGPADLPPVPGFIESDFNPLLYHVAGTCLAGRQFDGGRIAILLGSLMGDSTTTDLASRLLVDGQVHNALLFMQATSNSVLGHLSREFGITGPLMSLSTTGDELMATAELLLADPDLDAVLVLSVELVPNPRTALAYELLGAQAPHQDVAVAMLLEES